MTPPIHHIHLYHKGDVDSGSIKTMIIITLIIIIIIVSSSIYKSNDKINKNNKKRFNIIIAVVYALVCSALFFLCPYT